MWNELIAAISVGGASIIASVVSLIVSRLNAKKVKTDIQTIKETLDASGGVFYVTCPVCGKRIYLKGVDIQTSATGGSK